MTYEAIHTFGSTTYFIFMLLFFWASSIPRANPGSGWWTISISCALVARLSLFFFLPQESPLLSTAVYVAFNVLEKPLLLTGLTRFLGLTHKLRWFWLTALAAEFWLVIALAAGFQPLVRASGYCTVNAGLLFYMGWISWQSRQDFPRWPVTIAATASFLLAAHWLAAPALIALFPSWSVNAFVLGTVLVLAQYLALLAAVLSQFQTRLIEAEAKALDLAFQDPLTGLNNQRYMNTLFDQALQLATRPHHVVAVFYIDLDNFKPINDSAGHAVGDLVLKTVAARLKSITRSTDICARVGGDEFVVIATQLEDEGQAVKIAEKLLAQLTEPILVHGQHYALGASIGIALYPLHSKHLAQLVQHADAAMYHVKRHGKSGYALHAPDTDAVCM